MKTKKSKTNVAAETRKDVAAVAARPTVEVAARTEIGLDGITVADGRVSVAVSLSLPRPTMAENPRWVWTGWNVEYLKKQIEKDMRRLGQTVANLEHVRRTVEARAAARAASRPAVELSAPLEKAVGERPTVEA
jgi:hypothetical protein